MRILFALLLLLGLGSAANAQTTCTSTLNQTAVLSSFADNSTQGITARNLRDYVCSAVAGSVIQNALTVTGAAVFQGTASFTSTAVFTAPVSMSAGTSMSAITNTGDTTLSGTSNTLTLINNQTGVATIKVSNTNSAGQALFSTTMVGNNEFALFGMSSLTTALVDLGAPINTFTITMSDSNVATFTRSGGLQLGAPSGGDKGQGTINASLYYANGTSGVSCSAGTVSIATFVVTNGLVTHC